MVGVAAAELVGAGFLLVFGIRSSPRDGERVVARRGAVVVAVRSDLELAISSDGCPRKAGRPVLRIVVLLWPEDNQRAVGRLIFHEQFALDGVANFFRRAAVRGTA